MKLEITKDWLDKHNVCKKAQVWIESQKITDPQELYTLLVKDDDIEKLRWCNWGICRILNSENKIRYAIYAAEKVLYIYEKQYPDDKRPSKAIEVAKEYLRKKDNTTAQSAAYAADAAYAAADAADAAYAAAYAANAAYAADAAYAAANAAYAADAAADAAYAAANAAYAAYAADAAERIKLMKDILEYGKKLVLSQDKE